MSQEQIWFLFLPDHFSLIVSCFRTNVPFTLLLGADLAVLYEVPTKALNQVVKRNERRFPTDFMYQLTKEEFKNLKSHFATSSSGWGGRRKLPLAFTEHGAIMVASILNTQYAIEASIFVVRAFIRLRQMLTSHKELARKLNELEQHLKGHDQQIQAIFEAIRQLMTPSEKPRKKIRFQIKESLVAYGRKRKQNTRGPRATVWK